VGAKGIVLCHATPVNTYIGENLAYVACKADRRFKRRVAFKQFFGTKQKGFLVIK